MADPLPGSMDNEYPTSSPVFGEAKVRVWSAAATAAGRTREGQYENNNFARNGCYLLAEGRQLPPDIWPVVCTAAYALKGGSYILPMLLLSDLS